MRIAKRFSLSACKNLLGAPALIECGDQGAAGAMHMPNELVHAPRDSAARRIVRQS